VDFGDWLDTLGFQTWTIQKQPGGHLCSFWLHTRMDSSCPAKSQVQFGVTKFAAVNAEIHAYARGKGRHLTRGVDLLRHFIDQVWAFDEEDAPRVNEVPTPTPPQDDDDWQVLDMRQYHIPGSEKVWFSNADASIWFVPDSSGAQSTCATWRAYRDDSAGVWWCNEVDRQLYFPAAA